MTHLDDLTPIEHWRTVDSHGDVLPWYTRPCLKWLVQTFKVGMWIFEYGCGESSKWYYEHGGNIGGVDSNDEWIFYDHLQKRERLRKYYISHIANWTKKFDMIIIDGDYRDDCTEYALPMLKKGGYLIADNFEQSSADLADWPKTRELTKHLPLTIFKEPLHIDWQSAVWRNA